MDAEQEAAIKANYPAYRLGRLTESQVDASYLYIVTILIPRFRCVLLVFFEIMSLLLLTPCQ